MSNRQRPALGGVFGGGGLFGIGWAMGVIEGLSRRGLSFTDAPMLGTSAGSWAATAVVTGVSVHDMFALDTPSFPNPRSGVLAAAAREIFGEARSPLVSVCACSLPRMRRTVFDGSQHALADLIAASSAVPGLLAPHEIDGVRYVDGGVRSATSVDFGPDVDRLVVIAPLAGAMWGPFGRLIDRGMHNEISAWQQRTSGEVTVFSPVEAASRLAKNPRHLFDRERAVEAYFIGLEQAATPPSPRTA